MQKFEPILHLKRIIWLTKKSINFGVMHIDSASMKQIHKKAALHARKLTKLSKKRLKTVIYMLQSVKKHFSKSKSRALNAAHEQKTFLAQRVSSHGHFIQISVLGQKAA